MKNIYSVLFFILLSVILPAQTTFQKTIGGSSADYGKSIQQTTDGGYIIAGATTSFGSGSFDVYLIKTNSNGDTLWTKTYGELGSANEVGLFVQQTTDGGYIISGYTDISDQTGDAYLIKIDASGNVVWAKMYSSTRWGNCVKQTLDGGYIITGYTDGGSFFPGDVGVFLLKIDANGLLLWQKSVLDGGTKDVGLSLNPTTDGGYILTGYTDSYGAGGQDVFLIKTDNNGTVLWSKTYGGTNNDIGNSVQQTTDGGYIITGTTESFGGSGKDVYLIKTDTSGSVVWTKTFGGANADYGYFVQQTTDGGYIISGSTNSFGAGNSDAYLIKTDSAGTEVWTKTFGSVNDDYGYSVQQTIDSSYIILGSTGTVNPDVYLIKTNKSGNSGCNEENAATIRHSVVSIVTSPSYVPSLQNGGQSNAAPIIGSGGTTTTLCFSTGVNELTSDIMFSIYPNPAQSQITIEFELPKTKRVSIEIKNILGQTVKKIDNSAFTSGVNKIEFDVTEFSKGFYFVQFAIENGILSKKFVKE